MSSISIEKINDVYIRVMSEPSIEQELADRFTFMVEGYKFTPAYKSGVWDGKIRLYSLAKKTIYLGLLHHILKYAEENELTVNYLNEVISVDDIEYDHVKRFIDWLNIHSCGKSIELRDYQINGIHKAINQKRLLLLSPTSSGKSAIIYSLIRHHLEYNRRCLIIVPSISLVSQMYGDFVDYSSDNGWKTENHCHTICGGSEKTPSKKYKIKIDNGRTLTVSENNLITLNNGKRVFAKDLKVTDEICDKWLSKNTKFMN